MLNVHHNPSHIWGPSIIISSVFLLNAHYFVIFVGAVSVTNTFMKFLTVFDGRMGMVGRNIQHSAWTSTICSIPWLNFWWNELESFGQMFDVVNCGCWLPRKLVIINASNIQKCARILICPAPCLLYGVTMYIVYVCYYYLLWFDWKFNASTVLLFVRNVFVLCKIFQICMR